MRVKLAAQGNNEVFFSSALVLRPLPRHGSLIALSFPRPMLPPRTAALLLANAPMLLPDLAGRLIAAAGGIAEAHAQLRDGWCPDGAPRKTVAELRDWLQTADTSALEATMHRLQARLLLPTDAEFPEALKYIPEPPQWLFVQGQLPVGRGVAIVGSRATSAYGLQCTDMFASFLARSGICVVSGMAYGIDAAAHRAAIMAGGTTVAVVGTGLGMVYPTAHRRLSGDIAAHGAVVSEFPFDAQPLRWHFPIRNRLVSGMTVATIVVEAGEKSGSLITARLAANQGRDVFAVPADITRATARGCLQLLAQGEAAALYSVDQLAQALGIGTQPALPLGGDAADDDNAEPAPMPVPPWATEHEAVWRALLPGPAMADEVCQATGLPVSQVLSTLAVWHVQSLILQAPGGAYYLRG